MADSPKSLGILGKYERLEVIGDGAEGRVYKARCMADDVPGVRRGDLVALKRLKNTGQEKEAFQFWRQTEILRKLEHPNIIRYKDSFTCQERDLEDDIYCLVMEWVDGQTLKALLKNNAKGLPWELAHSILAQTLAALQHASKQGVVHRDLKLSNIYVTSQGVAKLIDFGIARQQDSEATATSSAPGIKGSFDYMAPDYARLLTFRGDERADIFSFGVCLYQTLTGELPFPSLGESGMMGYFSRWHVPPGPEPLFKHNLFRVLSHARSCIAKCLEPDRDKRFRSFDQVMAKFARIGPKRIPPNAEKYQYLDYLGKGGFGEVFRARRLSDKREVAVKHLFSAHHSRRFVREAEILRDAAHPNLVEYVDFVEAHPREAEREYYLVLEYLDGMPGASLRDRIRNSDAGLDPVEALSLFAGYLACLDHLHTKGIIHRDIKPGNLYAPPDFPQKAKVFDLGIAHDQEGTRTHGQVPGTLDYMPPEFASQQSERGSAQSDLYSLGVTLYQAITKTLPLPPLPREESGALIEFYRRSLKPADYPFIHPAFTQHPELERLLRRALSHSPKHRHGSASEMLKEVRGILASWKREKNREAYDESVKTAQAALVKGDYDEAERQAKRALDLWQEDRAAVELISRAVEGRRQEGFYHSLITAAQAALGEEDHHEAERQANQALKLRPGDPVAAHLLSQAVRNKRQKEFDNAMAAANAALARGNHDEAERQANLALKGQPGDQAALQILSQAKENRVARESEMDLEPPTAPTSSGAHGDRDTAVPPPKPNR